MLKKILSVFAAMFMAIALATPVSAVNTETTPNQNPHTITVTNKVDGHTYEAYQVLRGDMSAGVLTNITWGTGVNGEELLTALNKLTVTVDMIPQKPFENVKTAEDVANALSGADALIVEAFGNVVAENLSTAKVESVNKGTNADGKYVYDMDVLGDGYYFVKDGELPANTQEDSYAYTKYILKVVGDVTVTAKSDAPTIEKDIIEGEELVDQNNGSVGDTVTYQLTSNVPNMTEYDKYYFIIHDNMSEGLTFQPDSVNITITYEDKDGNKYPVILEAEDFEIVTEGLTDGCTFEIVMKDFIQYQVVDPYVKGTITVTYDAIINQKANIGSLGNPNKVYLEYSNNPNVDLKGENRPSQEDGNVTGTTPVDTVITYVTGINITKVDGAAENVKLAGATFTLTGTSVNQVKVTKEVYKEDTNGTYYLLNDGTYTETAPADETADQYASIETKYVKTYEDVWETQSQEVTITGTTDANGNLVFIGLGEGEYTITEIQAPAGYNLLKNPIVVNITFDETAEPIWSADVEGATYDETTGLISFTIANNKGTTLPETGGMGTTLFYVVGGLMVIGAIVLLITRKRMENK